VVVYSPRISPEFVSADKLSESHNPISEADFELKSGPKGGSEDFVSSADKLRGADKVRGGDLPDDAVIDSPTDSCGAGTNT
jgi:hypothetical protein